MAGIKIDITGDNTNFLKAIEGVRDGFTQASKIVEETGKSLDATMEKGAASTADLGKKVDELSAKLSEEKQKIDEQRVVVQQVTNDLNNAKVAYDTIVNSKGEFAAKTSEEKQELDAVTTVLAEEKGALSEMNLEYSKTRLELASTKAQIDQNNSTTQASRDSFQQIIDKIREWKDALSDIGAINERFASQRESIESVKESINNLSASSSEYSAKAQELRSEIESMNANMRLADGQLDESQKAAALDAIKAKIQEYGQALTDASASAQAAYTIEQQSVQNLETELGNLQASLQGAMASGNTEAASVIQAQITAITGELETARNNLTQLASDAENAKSALEGIGSVQAQLSEGATRGGSFFGNIIDEAQLIKEKVSDAFSSMQDSASSYLEPIKAKVSEVGQSISDYLGGIAEKIGFDRLGEQVSSTGDKLSDFKDKVIDVATGHGKLQESMGNLKTALNGLPLPLGNVLTSIGGVTKALWAMCSTPIGAVIAAVVIGLQAMYQWFTRSAEGQKVFTRISVYFGSIMSSLIDIIVIVGKYLYHAFADAGGPLNAFVRSLKTTFVSAVKSVGELIGGLGTTLKGIFTLDWDTFKEGVTKMGKGLVDVGKTAISSVKTTVLGITGAVKAVYGAVTDKNLGKELGGAFDSMLSKAEKASDMATRQLNAQIALGKAKEKEKQLDIEIAEKRDLIYKLTGKEKLEMIQQVKILQKAKFDDQIKAQTELYNLQKERNKLHTASLEDYKKERDLHIEVLSTQARQAASTRMMTRLEASTERKLENQQKQAEKKAGAAAKKAKSDAKKDVSQSNALESAKSKLDEVIYKNTIDRVKAEKAAEDKATDARIKAMKDGSGKVLAEKKRELDKELESIDQEREAAVNAERNRQKAEYEAQQAIIKTKGGKVTAWSDEMVDKTSIDKINQQYNAIADDIIKANDNKLEETRLEHLFEYLKTYGTIQEQKYAIAKEFDDKIAKAEDENQKKSLQRQKEVALSQANAKNMAMNIDWSSSFSGIGNVLQDIAKETLKEVQSYMQTAEFKALSPESKKSYTDLQEKLMKEGVGQSTSAFNFGIWGKISEQVKAYQDSVKDLKAKTDAHTRAVEELEIAEKNLANATDETSKAQAQNAVDIAKKNVETTGASQNNAQDKTDKAKRDLTDSTTQAAQGIKNFTSYLNEMSNGSLYGFANGITKLITSLFKGSDGIGKSLEQLGGKIGGIVGAILQIIDALGDDPSGFIDSLFEKIISAVDGILDQLASGELIKVILQGVGNLLETIAEHAFLDPINALTGGNLSFNNSNAKEVKEVTEKLTNSNESLKSSIDKLKDSVDKSNGAIAITDYKSAYAAQEKVNKQQMDILKAQMSYHDHHHSNAYYWGLESEDYAKINSLLGTNVKSLEDIYKLTPEQMDKIRTYNADVWAKMIDQGKYDKSEYWNNYADEAGKLNELTDQIKENLTQVTFDSLRDSFVSALMDMDSKASDFANDFEKYMMQALLNFAVGEKLDENLKKWYDSWAKTMQEQKGELTKEQIDSYKSQWDSFVQQGLETRDQIAALTGYSSNSSYSQSGTTGGWEAVGQDSIDELNGRFAALQLSNQTISDGVTAAMGVLSMISSFSTANNQVFLEIRNLVMNGNGYLEDTMKLVKSIYKDFGKSLDDVIYNTKSLR